MKRLLCLTLIVAFVESTHAFIRPEAHSWAATVKVIDETGQSVASAHVVVSYAVPPAGAHSRNWQDITGLTDTNGVFTTSHWDRSVYLGFQARKSGYYSSSLQHNVGFSPEDHPERLKPNVTLVLKRILKPIPMYAKSVNLGMPAFDEPIGFDLMAGDWVTPYGKGASSDMIFTAHLDRRSENDSDYRLLVSFPNPGDGIQQFTVPRLPVGQGSGLRSPHEAPLNGYQPQWVQTDVRKPGQPVQTNRDSERNYFFRVRTVLDERGKVKSALYGKIYRDFMQFRYYLNPTPNDRNVEFDPKQNPLQGLKSFEQVREP